MSVSSLIFTLVDITALNSEIRLWGRTKEGQSVFARTRSFLPYFYVECDELNVVELEEKIGRAYKKKDKDEEDCFSSFIARVEVMHKIPIMGWQNGKTRKMWKITLNSPKYVSSCRQVLEHTGLNTYEGSILYVLRYLVDKGIGGNEWVQLDGARSIFEHSIDCDIKVEFDEIKRLTNEFSMGPIRWMAFDIEACRGGDGKGFVDAQEDIVSQIGCSIFDASSYALLDKRCFSMGGSIAKCPDGVEVEPFTDEAQMLLAWARYVKKENIDTIVTYNGDAFDWPYLFDRARVLGILEEFCVILSRDAERKAYIRKATFTSRAKGTRSDFEVVIEGRFTVDLYKVIQDAMKLRSFTLGNVAKDVLGDSKVEMDYQLIPVYQAGTPEQRAHLCYYCWYDADLCRKIMQARRIILNNAETARFAGVPFKFVVTKGQQVLSTSLILRFGGTRNVVIPSFTENQNDEKTKGATVQEALVGFYECWIVVLDFRSLYPSIIQDRNICYSTKVSRRWAEKHLGGPNDYWVPPIENCSYAFVAAHIWKGILPEIEETLFGKRQDAKADLKAATDPIVKEVLDCRQNTIKLRMNALYGYLKANTLCDKDLMEAVTGEGRNMIAISKELAEREFPGTTVIYGDTDSIFIRFDNGNVPSKEEAFRLGYDCAKRCTKIFTDGRVIPVHLLQMEKALKPCLLCSKKKYVGLMYLDDGKPPKVKSTGLETVRRDNALIASETMQSAVDFIVWEGKKSEAIELVQKTALDLYLGRVAFHRLIISKNLSKSWKHYEEKKSSQPHVTLAKKIKARMHITGEEEYHTGDRVKYVFVAGPKGGKKSDNAEDPLYALQNRLSIDYTYYVENQMMKPLLRIFTPILAPGETMKKLNSKGKWVTKSDNELRQLTAYRVLFTGDHMNKRIQRVNELTSTVGIVGFTRRLPTCMECNVRVPHGISLCSYCEPKRTAIYLRLLEELNEQDLDRWRAWTRCQSCVGDKHALKISCRNKDCDNFYQREKVCIDIEDLAGRIERLEF